jgi:hypothetical protein
MIALNDSISGYTAPRVNTQNYQIVFTQVMPPATRSRHPTETSNATDFRLTSHISRLPFFSFERLGR